MSCGGVRWWSAITSDRHHKECKQNSDIAFLFAVFVVIITGYSMRIPYEAQRLVVSCGGHHKPVTALVLLCESA